MINNLFTNIPDDLKEELFEQILSGKDFKVERIVSDGHFSPDNFWYDQEENELVFLLQGSAKISFEDAPEVELHPGDYTNIPAHKKHRVEWTDNTQKTIWLAIHYK
jgi:cupin 2 domain-containing protein